MSFGSDTAATQDMSVGYSADVPGGATGFTGAGGPLPGGGTSNPQGPGLMSKLIDLLKDPEVQQALGKAATSFGQMNSHLGKLSPEAQQIVKQTLSGGGGGGGSGIGGRPSTGMGAVQTKPYTGDMPNFSAEHAQDTLTRLGIPFG